VNVTVVDESDAGFGWVAAEPDWMARTSHALAADGRVWLIDPVDFPELDDRVRALGDPQAVLQLVPWHNRDSAQVARRLGVTHLVAPTQLDGAPFQTIPIRGIPRWRETALWWPEQRTLVASEATGTVRYYRAPSRRLGIHPFLRLRPPHVLAGFEPEHILCGHGDGVHADAAGALREALDNALRDVPAVAPRVLTARRHRFSPGS